MTDRSIMVRLGATMQGLRQAFQQASSEAKKTAADIEAAGKRSDDALGKSERRGLSFGAAFKTASTFVDKHRDSLDRMGQAATVSGALLAGGLALVVRSSAQFGQAMSGVAATGQDARNNIDALRQSALKMGPELGVSAKDAAGAIESLLKAGVSAKDVLGGALPGALTLAAAGTMDVGDAAEIAATALTQFKLSGKDIPHVADLLAAGAGKAQGEVSDMAAALKQSGLVASQFGLSLEETVGTLTAFASAGLLGSDAGTSLRTMLLRLGNPAGEAADTMKRLGIAAYDSRGQFVGMASLADQLKTRLKGLTPAQRDAAMATIFGSDAIRAANVLYAQGAAGIQQWTSEVNAQGFASDTAATKLDNLMGDLKKLGAAAEAAAIQMGSGMDGPLRGLVKNATGLVEWFGKLPAPIQQGAAMLAGFGGGALLAGGALMKLSVSAVDTWRSFRDLVPAGSKLSGALGKLGIAATVASAAFATAAWIGSTQQQALDSTRSSVEMLKASLLGWNKSGSIAALDRDFSNLGNGLEGLRGAFINLKVNGGAATEGITNAVANMLGWKTGLQTTREQIEKLDTALSSMNATDAATAYARISEEATRAGFSTEELTRLFPRYRDTLIQAKNETQSGATALGNMAAQAEAATAAIRDHANALLALSGSEIGFEAAIDNAAETIKRNGRNLDLNTAAGRANRAALNDLATASAAYIEKLKETGTSSDKVEAAQKRAATAFYRSATAAGMSSSAAIKLGRELGLIPPNTKVNIKSTLDRKGIVDWRSAKIDPKTGKVIVKRDSSDYDNWKPKPKYAVVNLTTKRIGLADGGVLDRTGGSLVRAYADGGVDSAPKIGAQQPQVRNYAGPGGILWSEEGSGPWEAFVSGHPAKRGRSRTIAADVVGRLGGDVMWRNADGSVLDRRSILSQSQPLVLNAPTPGTAAAASKLDPGVLREALSGMSIELVDRGDVLSERVAARLTLARARR